MTYLNIDNKNNTNGLKKVDIDIVKLTYEGAAYSVAYSSSGTHVFNRGYCPILMPNKYLIAGTDFLSGTEIQTAVSNGITMQAFHNSAFDLTNYIYLFEYSFGYHGLSANESLNPSFIQLTKSSTVLNCFNNTAFPITSLSLGFGNSTTPFQSTNFYVSKGSSSTAVNYTVDLVNAEAIKGNFLISSETYSHAVGSPYQALVVRPSLSSTTATSPTGTVQYVEILIKRIRR